jgi:hypothetical protein
MFPSTRASLLESLTPLPTFALVLGPCLMMHSFVNYTRFPVQPCWTLARPTPAQLSKMNSALLRLPQLWGSPPPAKTANKTLGPCGNPFVLPWPRTQPSNTARTPSRFYGCSPISTEQAWWLPPVLKSALAQWRAPFVPWGRRLPHWACLTPGSNHQTPAPTQCLQKNGRPTDQGQTRAVPTYCPDNQQ